MVTESACCKVGALSEKYVQTTPDGADIDDELVTRWLGTGSRSSVGYRTLTKWFNKRLLKEAYEEAGRNTMSVRIKSDYDALTGDDIVKMELIDELEASGIDGEALLDGMISWSTMRNHLKKCLGAEKELQTADTDWERKSIEVAKEKSKKTVREALQSFRSKGKIEDEQGLNVEIKVHLCCTECPTRVPMDVALNRSYVCPNHRSTPLEETRTSVEVDNGSDKSFHWSTTIHHRQEPSFGV